LTKPRGEAARSGVPQTRDELNSALRSYFSVRGRLRVLKTRLDARLQGIKDQYAAKMRPLQAEENALREGITVFSEAHRAELTADGTKSEQFPQGIVGWRYGNWAHEVSTSDDEVIAALEGMGLGDKYVITPKKELNAQLLIRDREVLGDSVPGLGFKRGERFYIDPPKKAKAKKA